MFSYQLFPNANLQEVLPELNLHNENLLRVSAFSIFAGKIG